MSFYIHTDAYTDVNVGMGIGILIPEAMISESIIDKLASIDGKEILTVSDLVQEMFEYLVQFQLAQRDSRPNIRIYCECRAEKTSICIARCAGLTDDRMDDHAVRA